MLETRKAESGVHLINRPEWGKVNVGRSPEQVWISHTSSPFLSPM